MNQFWIEKINEHKLINSSNYFPYNKIDFSELSSINNVNPEFENIKNKIPLYNELINDDNDKDIESYQIKCFPYMNSLSTEPKNFSSINNINDNNKFFDLLFIPSTLPSDFKCTIKKKKIFEISKVNKRKGRLKKNSILSGKHNKLAEDNIIRKIKRKFLENLRVYINKEYKKYRLEMNRRTNRKNWLKKINPKFSCEIRRNDNLKWFNLKIYEVFSENLSSKYKSNNLDLNKKKIQNFFSLKESSRLKEILNTTIGALYTRYVSNDATSDFINLKDDLRKLEDNMKKSGQENIKEYLNKYEYIAKNLKSIFMKKLGRKTK